MKNFNIQMDLTSIGIEAWIASEIGLALQCLWESRHMDLHTSPDCRLGHTIIADTVHSANNSWFRQLSVYVNKALSTW